MPEGTTTNKVVQLKDPTTKEPVSPVVNVGSIYDKNGNKVDNLLSYTVAGTDVPIPEIKDIASELQQQVDDKLNESLGDISTPAQSLGLPSNASIGDLFNTLASVGDLHVWRRTAITESEIPPEYTLGGIVNSAACLSNPNNAGSLIVWEYSDSITVNSNGNLTLDSPSTIEMGGRDNYLNDAQQLIGKFIKTEDTVTDFSPSVIYFIPTTATVQHIIIDQRWHRIVVSQRQDVTGHAAIPPGTHIDYPVSTNPNAYQEGSDAQPAGYTLGAEQQALVKSLYGSSTITISYSDSVSVSDDGTVSLVDYQTGNFKAGTSNVSMWNVLKGKFYGVGASVANYYVPDNAVFSAQSNGDIYVDKRQTVTGYPAIPAGTIIEYLGVLGDKARMQIVSYVGTGTHGENNPCSITADFPIKVASLIGIIGADGRLDPFTHSSGIFSLCSDMLGTSYSNGIGFYLSNGGASNGGTSGKTSEDGKTINWYNSRNANDQLNASGFKYIFLCEG